MLTVTLLLAIAITQVAVSLGILLESKRSRDVSQKLFVLLSFTVLFWTIANALLTFVDSTGNQENIGYFNFANKVGFMLGASSLLLIYVFSLYYPIKNKIKTLQKAVISFGAILIVLSPLQAIAGTFSIAHGTPVYKPGSSSVVYAIFAVAVVVAMIFDNIKALHHTRNLLLKRQMITMIAGLLLSIVHAVIFIIILPLVYSDSPTIYAIGYLAPYFFMAATVYSLLRQNLFDVRLIVARSVAYIMLFLSIVIVFAGLVFVAPAHLLGLGQPNLSLQVYYTLAAIVLAFAFQPLKNLFNRVTDKLFYQDAYNPQIFLNDLNQQLASTVDINELLKGSGNIVGTNIKANFCTFVIHKTPHVSGRIVSTTKQPLNEEEISRIHQIIPPSESNILLTDYLEEKHERFKNILKRNNIALIVRLVTPIQEGGKDIGYLLLGYKKSGNLYNSQDIRILEIIGNELVIAIQNALRFEEIQNFNITLQEEVERQTRQLREANKRLKLLDRTKDDFISMASHQLRTPLTSVKGYLSMTLEGDGGAVSKKQRKLLSQAFISSQRMVYLIADMLNVSRLKTGKFVITPEPTDLAEAVQTEIDQLKGTAAARGLTLTFKKPKDFPVLMLDQTKIRQVIMNFADNAIYYTPSGGHIDVELKDTDKTIELTVTDDGIGVPKGEQHRLFSKFYRAGNAKKARPDGTGLGLYMAKKVIIGHGGSVIFKSKEGKGSTFGFSINKSKLEPATGAKAAPTKSKADELDKSLKLET